MKKKTKIIILTAMVLLLGVTGYLNILLNNSTKNNISTSTTTVGYFTSYRSERSSTRDQEILYYDAIIDSPSSSQDAIKSAENKKLAIIARMEQELAIEGLVKAQGFEDCVVSISDSGKVSVVVKCASLTEPEVTKIETIVKEQLEMKNSKNISLYTAE